MIIHGTFTTINVQQNLLYPHSRVEQSVEDVGENVDEHQEEADEEDGTHDDREIVLLQAVDDDDAHALPVEDILDEDGTGQKRC